MSQSVDVVEEAVESGAVPLESPAAQEPLVIEELLVEEVSIDGMCGVY